MKTGDTERSQVLADHIDILSVYLCAHHHSEDIHLWPKLLERGSQEVAPIIYLMENQHKNIESLNNEVGEVVGGWRINPVIQETLAELPPEVRAVLQEQGPRAFASHSERVYGTATPGRPGSHDRYQD